MKNVYVWTFLFVLLVCPPLSRLEGSASSGAIQQPERELLGKLSNGEYSFPDGKLKIRTPSLLMKPGAKIRDEKAPGITQVIWTDLLGAFYRVFTIDNSRGEFDVEVAMKVFKGIRERETISTARGKELRIVDVEKEGAEIIITTMGRQRKPDLLTANASLASNQMIICVTAGLPIYDAGKIEAQVGEVKKRLEQFLSGIEISDGQK